MLTVQQESYNAYYDFTIKLLINIYELFPPGNGG